ncbi:MAG TPA: BREX protein BrxB domain-containing protein [Polyangiaceae bacterium]|nr:BREX protein BrxB domain-containing protein [Polyangiaceae bacterium]
MTFRHPTEIEKAVDALRKDLLRDDGPQISTVRNYNFAILPYAPEDELALRRAVHELSGQLRDGGWTTGTVVLHSLLLARLRAQGPDFIESLVRREKSLAGAADPTRGMRLLKERIVTLLEGPEGLAADVIQAVERILGESANPSRTVIFLGRAGALYPFFRTSALLKHVAEHTRNVPVVLLYPGRIIGESGLSFMGVLPADRDYRPRIYR